MADKDENIIETESGSEADEEIIAKRQVHTQIATAAIQTLKRFLPPEAQVTVMVRFPDENSDVLVTTDHEFPKTIELAQTFWDELGQAKAKAH